MNRKQIKVALAGTAGFGDTYLGVLLSQHERLGIDLVGLVDPAPHRCTRLEELKRRELIIHPSIESLFATHSVDLMMIATPIHLHAPHTCFALERGANVLCEKPLAGTLADALRMLRASQSSSGFAAIGYQWSFSEPIQSLKRDVISGVLGRCIRMKALAFFPRPVTYFRRNGWAGRIHLDTGYGVLDSPVNNATAHYLHNMFYVLGRTRETSAMPATVQAELYRINEIDNYDTAAIRCKTDCGVELLFYTTLAALDRCGPRLQYEFENAIVEFNAGGSSELVARFHDGTTKVYGNPDKDRTEKIAQCIDAVRTGAPVACDIPASISHTLCVVSAQHSVPSVTEFPVKMREEVSLGDDVIICARGLPEALLDCYDRNILPAEDGQFGWSREGKAVAVDHPELSRPRARTFVDTANISSRPRVASKAPR